ncbi:copper-binding protein [Rhodococcus sp. P27]|nr:copper-binding protein [Rhodococcus sp. P27]
MKRILAVLAALILAVFALTACSDNNDSSDNDSADHDGMAMTSMAMTSMPLGMSTPGASSMGIVISGFGYSTPESVMPGQVLTIQNNDTVEHSVTSDTAGLFNEDIEAGETETITVPNEPGTYTFHCTYHPSMRGTLTVK